MARRTLVTINAGHTRRVVTFALWRIASNNIVGEHELSDSFFDRAWGGIHPAYVLEGVMGQAEFRLSRLAAVESAVRAVESATDGERLDLPVSPEELIDALRDCVLAIDQNDELFWGLSAADQQDVAGCRDAAARLLATIQSESQASPPDETALPSEPARPSEPALPSEPARNNALSAVAEQAPGGPAVVKRFNRPREASLADLRPVA